MSLLYRAPYVASLLGLGQSIWDRDEDGYSPILLGGDCNDHSRQINPNAVDIPGNDIDENCSGKDAGVYKPPAPPSYRRPSSMPDKTNVIFILLDAMRPDHFQFNGYHRKTAPNLENFSKASLYFKNAYTPCPRTESVLTAIFTGQDPLYIFALFSCFPIFPEYLLIFFMIPPVHWSQKQLIHLSLTD